MTITRVPTDMAQALSPAQRQSLEHFYGALGTQDVDLVDQALTSDWEDIPLAPGQAAGPEGVKLIFRMLISAFPDLSAEITEVLAEAGRALLCRFLPKRRRRPIPFPFPFAPLLRGPS